MTTHHRPTLLSLIGVLLLALSISPTTATAASLSQGTGPVVEHHRGQSPQDRAEELRKQCIAYVTKECQLTPEEAKVLDREAMKSDQRKMVLWRERAGLLHKIGEGGMTEEEYGEALDRVLELDVELRKCRQEFFQALKPHLSQEKRAKVYLAIIQFNRDFYRGHSHSDRKDNK